MCLPFCYPSPSFPSLQSHQSCSKVLGSILFPAEAADSSEQSRKMCTAIWNRSQELKCQPFYLSPFMSPGAQKCHLVSSLLLAVGLSERENENYMEKENKLGLHPNIWLKFQSPGPHTKKLLFTLQGILSTSAVSTAPLRNQAPNSRVDLRQCSP